MKMKSRSTTHALVLAALSAVTAASALAQAPAKPAPSVPAAITTAPTGPVATVNGVAIPQQRAELLVRERSQQGQPDSPQVRAAVRDELVNREIISQEANKSGL